MLNKVIKLEKHVKDSKKIFRDVNTKKRIKKGLRVPPLSHNAI